MVSSSIFMTWHIRLGIPLHEASKVMCYLRSLSHVDKEAETSQCKSEPS